MIKALVIWVPWMESDRSNAAYPEGRALRFTAPSSNLAAPSKKAPLRTFFAL